MNGYIYGLYDASGNIRYVGKSVNPDRRLETITDVRKGGACGPLLKAWVFRNIGTVQMRIIERCHDMDERERHWIAKHRADGKALLNIQPGGDFREWHLLGKIMKDVLDHWSLCVPPAEPQDIRVLEALIREHEQKKRRMRKRRRLVDRIRIRYTL